MKVIRVLFLAAGLTFGGVSAAHASCNVIVASAGATVGGLAGFIVDVVTAFTTIGQGTAVGIGVGGSGGRVLAEYVCPDSDSGGGYEELDLRQTLVECLDNAWMPKNPFWNRRDFCTVPRNPFIQGRDVSMISGRQLDQSDVIGQLQTFYKKLSKKSKLAKDFAGDLRQCRRSFDERWWTDVCYVTPSKLTSKYWKAPVGKKVRRTVDAVLEAATKTLKSRFILDASAKTHKSRT